MKLVKVVCIKGFTSNGGHSYDSRVDRGFADVPHKPGDAIELAEQRTWHHAFLAFLERTGVVKVEILTHCDRCGQKLPG